MHVWFHVLAHAVYHMALPVRARPRLACGFMITGFLKGKQLTASLQMEDIVVGDGETAQSGKTARVHYTGWLENGNKFDSSTDRNEPFSFHLGQREVIQGWDVGVEGMKVGGIRKLTIPPHMAYGTRGAGGVIPPNATLVFEIELLAVR